MPRVTKAQLQSDLDSARLQRDIAKIKLQSKLSESFISPPYDLVNPWSQFFDGPSPIFPLYPSRWDNRNLVGPWVSESQLDLIRMYARWLYDTNLTAKGVIRSLENYIIHTGFEYTVAGKGKNDDKSSKVRKIQEWVDRFTEKNRWYERELDYHRRLRRDGEWFCRLFPESDGVAAVRIVEPEQVRPPDTSPEWQFGVLTDNHDRETVKAYFVTYDGVLDNGEVVNENQVVHMKVNTDLVIRRGLSDFFASQESLQAVAKLLKASVLGEAVRQSISYIRQHQQANQQTILALQQANTDYDTPVATFSGFPRLQPTQQVLPGSVLDIPEPLEYQNGPVGNGANAVAILDKAYQALSAYWQVPAWMLSGDSGNVNFASSLTMESPFVRNCEKEQKLLSNKFKEIILKAIHISIEQGELPEDTLDEITLMVHCPPVVVRNQKEETDRNLVLASNGLLSKRTWSDREELDYEHEQETRQVDNDQVTHDPEKISVKSETPNAQYQRMAPRP